MNTIETFIENTEHEISECLVLIINYDISIRDGDNIFSSKMYDWTNIDEIYVNNIKSIRVLYYLDHIVTLIDGEFYTFKKNSLPIAIYYDIIFILKKCFKYNSLQLKLKVKYE